MTAPHLYYFSRDEFERDDKHGNPINWFDQMNPRLLVILDVLRFNWSEYRGEDSPIILSPAAGALGRQLGEESISDHNIDRWKTVNGVDAMPAGLKTREDANVFRLLARDATVNALGLYPDWEIRPGQPSPGLHIGVRAHRKPGDLAVWGAVDAPDTATGRVVQTYTTWDAALERMPL
ncbi:MAG: hypothetical protein KDI55_19965 [Anaerolineae bacterium]|nr:hypothetical protein [Anaerolineae bacterium]